MCADYRVAGTAMALVGKACVSVVHSVMYVYTSEIYPTEVRSVGLSTATVCARISGILAAYCGGPMVGAMPTNSAYQYIFR